MQIYESHRMQDPRLPFIFHDTHLPKNTASRRGNWHENLEILVFLEGSATVTSNALRLSVTAGDTVILNSNVFHTISSHEPAHYYCLIVDRSFCLSNHFDTNTIRFSPLVRDDTLIEMIEALVSEFRSAPDTPYRVQSIRAQVLATLVHLCRHYSCPEETDISDSHLLATLKQAIGYIHVHYAEDLSLDFISEMIGLSKFYFAREFHRLTGYTFVSYINLIRCDKARRLLSEGQLPIGQVAAACGFPSQSYFTRTFKKQVGMLPNAYRKQFSAEKGAQAR